MQPDGSENVRGSKHGVKRLPIQLAVAEADANAAAAEAARLITASSKLIHPSRAAEVQALVSRAWEQLHVSSSTAPSIAASGVTSSPAVYGTAASDRSPLELLLPPAPVAADWAASQPPVDASISRLEQYIVSARTKGAVAVPDRH